MSCAECQEAFKILADAEMREVFGLDEQDQAGPKLGNVKDEKEQRMNLWEQTYPTLLQHLQQKLHFSWKFGDNHVKEEEN